MTDLSPQDEPAARGLTLAGEPLPRFDAAPANPIGHSPPRRAGSVRRTSSLTMTWPEGRGGALAVAGRARDLLTPASGAARVLREDAFAATIRNRAVAALALDPPRADSAELVGLASGGPLRGAVAERWPDLEGTPQALLLDDLAGAVFVSGWSWSVWEGNRLSKLPEAERAGYEARMSGVCMGFRLGSDALARLLEEGHDPNTSAVPEVDDPADPLGWHDLAPADPRNFRRARRIDLWREGADLLIDGGFQDSASGPEGGPRTAIHEYRVFARIDAAGTIVALDAMPGTLPHKECPAAVANLVALVGTPVADLRRTVIATLRRSAGCTHLNDMLRALADVPVLAAGLPVAEG